MNEVTGPSLPSPMAKQNLFVGAEGALYQGGSGNDTIQNFTGKFSANTIKGGAGNDLISFAHQTTAVTITATATVSNMTWTAGTLTVSYNGPAVTAGSVVAKATGTVATWAGKTAGVATFQSLRNTALLTGQHSFIQGGEGNDTVQFGDFLVELSGTTVEGGQGNDLIGSYNSGASTAGKFNGSFLGNRFRGAKGNDVISVDVSSLSVVSGNVLNGNSGNDTVIFSSEGTVAVDVKDTQIFGGKGNDDVSYQNAGAGSSNHVTIAGGAGNDVVTVKELGSTFASGLIELDSNNAGTGKDTLYVDFAAWSGTTINSYAGVDSIIISSLDADGGGNLIDMGRGNDIMEFNTSTIIVSGSTIQGGQGNDKINNSANAAVNASQAIKSSVIRLGAGNDTIILSSDATTTAGNAGATIVGGLGADYIELGGIGVVGSGTFAFSSYSDSKLGSGDTVMFQTASFAANGASQNASTVNFTIPDSVALASGSQTAVGGGVSGVSGVINFSGVSDNLTARVNALDAGFTTTGTVAFFTVADNNEFIFVQGGSDDLIVKINDSTVLSAGAKDGTLSIMYSGKAFGFGT
jgi:hypothetical protein